MLCFYRYSDKGKNPTDYGYGVTKRQCFESFFEEFKGEKIILILDNSSDESYDYFKPFGLDITRTSLGNGASAYFAMEHAIKSFSEEIIYFAEDDYLYKSKKCVTLIKEGLEFSDYCSLYDHGDKYKNFNSQPNPLLKYDGESTVLFRTKNSHWKYTNSSTMTFATRREVLFEDLSLIKIFCTNPVPLDFRMFLELERVKKRKIATCVPGRSTHLSPDKENMSPFFYD